MRGTTSRRAGSGAWLGGEHARRHCTDRSHAYGWRSSSILAALFNAILLLISVGAIAWEAIRRFGSPIEVAGRTVIWVSLVGIAINAASALMFMSGRKVYLNIRSAFLHMVADAAVSAAVVVAGIAILWTGFHWIDPVVSLVIAAVIVWGTWGLLRESLGLALQAAPEHVDVSEVRNFLSTLPGVTSVHDLHVWPLSTTQTALTAHLEMRESFPGDAFLHELCVLLYRKFHIEHCTFQLEQDAKTCALASEDMV